MSDPNKGLELEEHIQHLVSDAVRAEMKNGFSEWAQYILLTIEDLKETDKEVLKCHAQFERELAVLSTQLKLKSGMWGALAGIIAVIFGVAIFFIKQIIAP